MLSLPQIIDTLPSLRTTVDAHQLMATKALGQNFLLDQNITDKIIRCSLTTQNKKDFSDSFIYEIGPGPGGLTRASIKANPKAMTVIEMDPRCVSIMEELQSKTGNLLQIINGDALKHNYSNQGMPTHIVSNLPYNISVPLLIKWLSQIKHFTSLTLMFQKEVADRIMAPTHCKDFGRISILSQLQCKITKLFDLNPECFTPAPKIWSTVLLFQPHETTLSTEQIAKLEKITASAFSARRKMIRQSLKSYNRLEQACEIANIPLTSRPEEITPQQFLLLSQNM
ncbi:MAG: ribosomal RNA small subunit methyltransferase A [Alphaproteobacteria bacterium]|nr:ribosomal RNA small subunit methyltransferase A [Alphaproteobacteria bacterium]